MDAERWKQLEALFFTALELDPAERPAFLESACGNNKDLRQELELMLAADEDSMAFALESRLLSDEGEEQADPSRLMGTRIGPYKLEKLIGEGGMGEVYLAQRDDDQFDQKVALKLVRPGHRNVELYRRFRMERQVLARLMHPNITQLLDGGIDDAGRPYLVMQYIEGLPITEFCDKNALSIDDRLELFRTVCAAVQHAHQNLVVHRDLKPSNILVTEDGIVKLLDFGIAKLLDPNWNKSIAVTRSQIRLMTPEYAAPEQIKGAAITTATDVYALGVLLYELLSGRRPYRLIEKMQREVERIICEEDPVRLSTVLSERKEDEGLNTATEAVSRARRTGVSRLRKILQGDLDNIVMMALRKEPERRYATAEQFSQDIMRYLTGLPVIAKKGRVTYRFKKFVYRHQTMVATLTAAFILAVGFGIVMTFQAQNLAIERDRAQSAASRAQQISDVLEELFKASDPFQSTSDRRDTLRVRDFLDQGTESVEDELKDQPVVQAALLDVLGAVYQNLGELDTAFPLLTRALTIRQDVYNTEHLEIAESMAALAALYNEKGNYSDATSLLDKSIVMRRNLLGNEHPDIASDLQLMGLLNQNQGAYPAAESLYNEAFTMQQAFLGTDHPKTIINQNYLADIQYLQGKYNLADSIYKEVLAKRRKTLSPDHPKLAGTMNNQAMVLQRKGDLDAADTLFREALVIRQKVLGPTHPHTAQSLNNLAALLKAKGDFAAAEPLYRESLASHRSTYGDEHPEVATSNHNLAALLKAKGDYEAAIPLYVKALTMRRKLLGNEHPSVAATLNNLGVLLKAKGDYKEAEPYLQEALAVNRRLLNEDHPRIGLTLDTLGDLYYKSGRFEEAETAFEEALSILTKQFSQDHRFVIQVRKSLEKLQDGSSGA